MSNLILPALEESEIIPDVLPVEFKTTQFKGTLDITYPNGDKVLLGNDITPENSSARPTIVFNPNANSSFTYENKKFILIMTDPDAPSRTDKKYSEVCHMIECDVELIPGKPINGTVMNSYIGPGPPKGAGKHRYIFLLFDQNVKGETLKKVENYICWGYNEQGVGVDKWIKENGINDLLAVNFFYAENK
ncbi:hypothetical protein TBLA_0B00460 [Henningerozyma blattae CBS 6284]|uniref:PEBP-like protein n=1 Tax=Henningerozyma blattae (strain ATCC 34711 / CBS 6284 / DSM 70876 / NBRC 10599 / NRRL Y-10934 / UCD 77-7) TaxID=1071380 RepID=I2GXN8_HENB6|nr:hypothetical protein TBLA_0B00460 [Tetrapisispora blattae CBS 6284]CCH58890.1 hypothetical protein TBLA_0B00460 [Tetrapisispora blattae CBS 6284]